MVIAACIVAAVVSDPSALAVEVTGPSRCPAAGDVAAALPGLIAGKDPAVAADRATLTDDGTGVTVTLQRASGEPVGEKRMDAGLSCEQRARAAAVIIAAWEAQLGVQTAPLVVEPDTAPAPAAIVASGPPPAMVLPRGEDNLELGASAGGSINGTTLAPAAALEVAHARAWWRVVPAVTALFVGSHQMAVGPGNATWRRYGLLATVASRRDWRPLWAEARLGAALTLLDIRGTAFPSNGAGFTFDPGIDLGARFGLRARRVRWWLDAAIALWPRTQNVYVQGSPGSAALPRGQALLSLGAAYELPIRP